MFFTGINIRTCLCSLYHSNKDAECSETKRPQSVSDDEPRLSQPKNENRPMGTKFSQKMRFGPIKKKIEKKFFFVITVRKWWPIFENGFRKTSISRYRTSLQRWIIAQMKEHIRNYLRMIKFLCAILCNKSYSTLKSKKCCFFVILEIAHIPVTLPVNSIAQNSVKKIGISTQIH